MLWRRGRDSRRTFSGSSQLRRGRHSPLKEGKLPPTVSTCRMFNGLIEATSSKVSVPRARTARKSWCNVA
jgi:hypothetical protein